MTGQNLLREHFQWMQGDHCAWLELQSLEVGQAHSNAVRGLNDNVLPVTYLHFEPVGTSSVRVVYGRSKAAAQTLLESVNGESDAVERLVVKVVEYGLFRWRNIIVKSDEVQVDGEAANRPENNFPESSPTFESEPAPMSSLR